MHLHGRGIFRLAIGERPRDARVEPDGQAGLIALAALLHPDRVGARRHARTLGAGPGELGCRRHVRRGPVHGPEDTVEPAAIARLQLIDDRAAGVEYLDLHLAEQVTAALIVGNRCAAGRVVADEHGGAIRPSAIRLDALLDGTSRKEGRILRQQQGTQVAQRRDVIDDPDAAAMGCQHQVVVPRLDGQVADRHRRQMAALERGPVGSGIRGDPQPELGAEEQQLRVDGIFLDHMRIAAHALQVGGADEPGPGRPVIMGDVDIRGHVALGMPVEGRIRGARGEVAGLDPAHPGTGGEPGHMGGEVLPMGTAIAGQLQIAVIGADPDLSRGERRLADRVDRRVHFGRGIVDGDAARQFLQLLVRIVGREVRGNAFPGLATVRRTKQELRADVQRLRIVRRQRDRRIPVEAQLRIALEVRSVQPRLDVPRLVRQHIDAHDGAALCLRIHMVGIRRIGEHPEAVAAEHGFPALVGDAARVG